MASKEDYNKEPVWYCRECLSLTIMNSGGQDYCRDCGSTDITWAPIDRWEKLYRMKYGYRLMNKPEQPPRRRK